MELCHNGEKSMANLFLTDFLNSLDSKVNLLGISLCDDSVLNFITDRRIQIYGVVSFS